ncbi:MULTISPECIES: TIGR02678 family protein [Saccharothrix]|uniref:TIGR02678 family protein n=1 Tax=Saccharothrix TaxID=2071 RepID=UPI000940017A|nr:TIGR02678 family protein [Saccharothrix sp. CB00851]OKI17394.1 hypothetical protein A6A25_41030 [Saccharothrix sp. CB00851]
MNDQIDEEDLRLAARTLLARPLLRSGGPDAAVAATIRRPVNQERLQRWFDNALGWKLIVERDVVRLHKVPAVLTGVAGDAPGQRCSVLYCLILAGLEEFREQTVISELAELVERLSAARPAIRTYDAMVFAERRDLVAAIRLLVDHGVLVPTRGDASTAQDEHSYVTGDGDAIYDIDHRAAALMLACPVPPTRAGTPAGLIAETIPDTPDGHNRARRHGLMRRLVEDPVLYLEEVSEAEREYFRAQRHALVADLTSMLDVRVEVRLEGAAIIDDELSDVRFPQESTPKFAALLLAGLLAAEPGVASGAGAVVPLARLMELASRVAEQVAGRVATILGHKVTAEAVLHVASSVLSVLRLVEPVGDGLRPLPALGRYRVHGGIADPSPEASALFDADTEGGERE